MFLLVVYSSKLPLAG